MTNGLWPWTDWQQGARWDEWTWPRGLAAVALVLASVVGSFLLAAASIAPCLFGPECTYAALPQLWAAAVVLLLGPLVVFAFRRRVVWALTPPALLAGLLAAPLAIL